MAEEPSVITLEVKSDDRFGPVSPDFSNFLQISRVATEIQFEFLFVDISQVALAIQKAKESSSTEPEKLSGLTVAKVVLPALSFIQVKDHINRIFEAIEKEIGKLPDAKEVQHGDSRVVST